MNSNGVMISAGQVRVSDGLHLSYDHIDGYRPGVPSEALMNVTSLRTTGPVVTTTFAEGDHWGELVLDRTATVWSRQHTTCH